MFKSLSFLLASLATVTPLVDAATPTSYAGEQARDIKALTPEEIDAYLAGKGQGLAKAAELNGYPGPMHVLELAGPLGLTLEQRQRTEALFAAMQAEARQRGRHLVDAERELDRLFATKAVTAATLEEALQRVASAQASVRRAHLDAHLAQIAILSQAQSERYAELRGYRGERDRAPSAPAHRH